MENNKVWYTFPSNHDWVPPGMDLQEIVNTVRETGVWAPGKDIPAIEQVVHTIRNEGLKNFIVISFPRVYPSVTVLRDVAEYVQHEIPGTVLVMDQHLVAAASNSYPRVVLEKSEQKIPILQPEQAAQIFAHRLHEPAQPWGLIATSVVLLSVTIAIFHKYINAMCLKFYRSVTHLCQRIVPRKIR